MQQAETLAAALEYHRAGRLDDADRIYVARLAREPLDAAALALGGVVRLQRGVLPEALEWLDRSLAIRADQPDALANRAAVLLELGRAQEALAGCDGALRLEPLHVEAHLNRGRALEALGRLDEALDAHRFAISLNRDVAAPHEHAGVVLQRLERWDEALAAHDRAVALQPQSARAHSLRGAALLGLARFEEALAAFDRALALDPHWHDAIHNRAVTLLKLGRWAEALEGQRRALELAPDDAGTWSNAGIALHELGAYEEALRGLERAIALRPGFPAAHYNHGRTLMELKRWDAAADAFARTLALRPDHPHALGNFLHARMQLCDWRDFDELQTQLLAAIDAGRRASSPMPLLPIAASARQQFLCAQAYARDEFGDVLHPPAAPRQRLAGDRLRVAYLSADFRDHPVAHLLVDLVEAHDRERFEVTGIACGPASDDPVARRLRAGFDRWLDAGRASDAQIATSIRELGIDVVIDLGGYTSQSRVAALRTRPAAVQIGYLGYTGTYAAPFIDYVIADAVVLPDEHRPWYGESVIRMPHSYQVNSARESAAATPSRSELGLPADAFVYCCFNAYYKITPDAFGVWMGLLDATPGAVLWLAAGPPLAMDNLRAAAARCGVDPRRLVFAPRVADRAAHFARYRAADLFLDTFNFGAHTTAGDALAAGLPVITRRGQTFAGRVAASLLHALGLPDLVADSAAGYAALAHGLSQEPAVLADVRATLADGLRTQPLFDVVLFARHFEAALETAWERCRDGLPPSDLVFGAPAGTA